MKTHRKTVMTNPIKKLLSIVLALSLIMIFPITGFAAEYTDQETVSFVQSFLNRNGYDCGIADGIAGSQTEAAILQFQRDHGIPEDGKITDELLAAVRELQTAAADEYGLNVSILDVGQGLCVLLESDGAYCLFDGGPGSASSKVVSLLQFEGLNRLDYMIASHYDEDHISGLIGVLYNFQVDNLLMPYYVTTSSIYNSFMNAVSQNGVTPTYVEAGQTFQFGSAMIEIVAPVKLTYQTENDFSVAAKITYGNTSILITGDCTKESEADMLLAGMNVKSDILVLGHHGSDNSTSPDFLNEVKPMAAVVSCGRDNGYGHPSMSVMQMLADNGILLYRTDVQEDIYFSSDGEDWFITDDPTDDYSYRDIEAQSSETRSMPQYIPEDTYESEPQQQTEESNVKTYVLNTNTYKFHYPDCSSVNKMKEKNRQYIEATRDEIIAMGYEPCHNCYP